MAANQANFSIYGQTAVDSAVSAGIDPQIFSNLLFSESSFNPVAVNPNSVGGENAVGIAQFLPSTAASIKIDPLNPFEAIPAAANYLSKLIDQFGLTGGIAKYKGFSDINSDAAKSAAQNVINGVDGNGKPFPQIISEGLRSPIGIPGGPQTINPTQPGGTSQGWAGSLLDAITQYVKSSALGFSLGFIGLLIISISIVALVMRSSPAKQIVKNLKA